MPDIPKFSAFDVKSKLQQELTFNQTAGFGDPLAGTGISLPQFVQVQEVGQNPNGQWSSVISTQASPIKSQDQILNELEIKREGIIKSYQDLCAVYDNEILTFNTQINDKKNEIVTLIATAVSAGCTAKSPSGPGVAATMFVPGADDINGVACGIGSTIRNDEANVKIYPNMTAYTASSPVSEITTSGLSTSNTGQGYQTLTSNNSGTVLTSSYKYISSTASDHLGLSVLQQATCAGYGSSIEQIAVGIASLRNLRDQYLDQVNNLKDLKTQKEFLRWGREQGNTYLAEYSTKLQQAITDVSQYTDNIVTSGLIVHYDAAQSYGIEASVQSSTNINAVTKWNNLSGDGLYASPQTSLYQINLDNNDGPSVELNNYPTATNQYFSVSNSFIEANKIGSGNTSYTIETWVKVTNDVALGISSTTNGANIVGINSVHGYGLQVYKPNGIRVSFGERGNGRLSNNTDLTVDEWYHIVATNESGVGSKIYVNGSLDGTGSTINITSSTSDLQIGYASTQINQYFSGKVSVVRIYNKNFTQTDVTQNFNAHKSRYGLSTT